VPVDDQIPKAIASAQRLRAREESTHRLRSLPFAACEDRGTSLAEALAMAKETNDEAFVPRGAVAFFIALIGFFSAVWLSFYALLLHRR
jgi:hypothetical protein